MDGDGDGVLEVGGPGYQRWRVASPSGGELLVERWPGRPERARAAAAAASWLSVHGLAIAGSEVDGDTLRSAAPAGVMAGGPMARLEATALVSALGRALRRLHALPRPGPGAGGPGERTLGDLVAQAERRVAAGEVGPDDLRPAYVRFGPERLLELARGGLEQTGDGDAPVLSHGACSADHLCLLDGQPTAWLRLDALVVADRHLDLARLAKEVAERLGPEAVPLLFDAYGTPPDPARLDALALLDELLP